MEKNSLREGICSEFPVFFSVFVSSTPQTADIGESKIRDFIFFKPILSGVGNHKKVREV